MAEAIQVSDFVYRQIVMLNRDTPYSKAALAKLRQAVGKPREETPDVWDITLTGAPEGKAPGIAIHTALTLYALHRQGKLECVSDSKTSFGAAIANLANRNKNNESAIKRRFNAVATSTEYSELVHHARGLVQLLKANNITMNYPRFARELFLFQNPDRAGSIRLKWGEHFYRNFTSSDETERTENQ